MKIVFSTTLLSAALMLSGTHAFAQDESGQSAEQVGALPVRVEIVPVTNDEARLLVSEHKLREAARAKLEAEYATALGSILARSR